MTKNLYYRTIINRPDAILNFLNIGVARIASFPRLILEVFIRREFGERYFRMSAVFVSLVLLISIPIMIKNLYYQPGSPDNFWLHYTTWYLFTAAFGYVSWVRWREIKTSKSVFDFQRYSQSSGIFHPRLTPFAWKDGKLDKRTFETIVEPTFFFVIGLVLIIIGQRVGILISLLSIVYSLSYVAAYRAGDNYVLDLIDEMIANKHMKENFVDGSDDSESDFRMRARVPNDPEMRSQLLPQMLLEDEPVYAS